MPWSSYPLLYPLLSLRYFGTCEKALVPLVQVEKLEKSYRIQEVIVTFIMEMTLSDLCFRVHRVACVYDNKKKHLIIAINRGGTGLHCSFS